MAQFPPVVLGDAEFSCSICFEVLKDPVTIPCGHSYCMVCLKRYWDQLLGQETSCPQCRRTFNPRPALGRNTILAGMLEKLGQVRVSDGPTAPPLSEAYGFHHATFDVSSAMSEGRSEERRWTDTRRLLSQRIQEKEREVQELNRALKAFTRLSKAAVKDCSKIYSGLVEFLERRRCEVKELLRAHEKTEVTRAEGHLQRMEQEVAEMRRREAELERLCHTQDQGPLTQVCQSFIGPALPEAHKLTINKHISFTTVRNTISDMKERLESVYQEEFSNITHAVKKVGVLHLATSGMAEKDAHAAPIPVPTSREELLTYACPLSLDPFTTHKELSLSEGNRTVSRTGGVQSYPDHPDRFDVWGQALCREAVGGRGYWEAEWEGLQVELGLAYEDIARKGSGNDCGLGRNSLSWSLRCNASSYAFYHDNQMAALVVSPSAVSRKIGVFLDQRAGLVCFYSVTPENMTLLHMVQSSFSQPLYPAVWLGARSSITLCSLG